MGLALYPRFYSGLTGPGKRYFDPSNPRTFLDRLDKVEGLDKQVSHVDIDDIEASTQSRADKPG